MRLQQSELRLVSQPAPWTKLSEFDPRVRPGQASADSYPLQPGLRFTNTAYDVERDLCGAATEWCIRRTPSP